MVLNFNHKSKEKDKFINIILSEKEHILIKNYAEMNQQSIRKFSKKVILDYCHSQEAKKIKVQESKKLILMNTKLNQLWKMMKNFKKKNKKNKKKNKKNVRNWTHTTN